MLIDTPPEDDDTIRIFETSPDSTLAPPYLSGSGSIDSVCGCCGLVLLSGLSRVRHVPGLIFRCPRCDSYNALPPTVRRRPVG